MRALLRVPGFGLLWSAGTISAIGDMVLFIALPFYVYDLTGSTLASGLTFVIETVPRILFGSVAGVFVDRWDRRRVMVAADLLRAVGLLPLLLVTGPEYVWIVFAVGFFEATVSQFFRPARSAVMPLLVPKDKLVAANALSAQAEASMTLIGPILGGALLAWVGIVGVVVADAVSFIVSAVLICLIPGRWSRRLLEQSEVESTTGHSRLGPVVRDWMSGIGVVRAAPVVLALFAIFAVINVADGLSNVLWVPYSKGVLGVGPVEFGWLVSATGVGRIVGLLYIGRYGSALGPDRLIALGCWGAGLLMLFIVFFPSLPFVLAALLLLSPLLPGINVAFETLIQTHVADAYRGRVFGAWGTIAGVVTLLSMTTSSALGDVIGVLPLLGAAGLIYATAGVIAPFLLRRRAESVVDAPAGAPT